VTSAGGSRPGVLLEGLTWPEAEQVLTPAALVVIPLGAAAKEHGPHLPLNNDLLLAAHFARALLDREPVVLAPMIGAHFYPAFVEYPGSVHLRLETARDLVVDIVRSLARPGPRRFYVLNTGVSTRRPLALAAAELALDGILLRYTDPTTVMGATRQRLEQQERGSHADEVETSLMLAVAPQVVRTDRLLRDDRPEPETGPRGLTRDPAGAGVFSPSGVWGDATLATREKGEELARAYLAGLLADLQALRRAELPVPSPA
jgi:creatinine amidohydrolase